MDVVTAGPVASEPAVAPLFSVVIPTRNRPALFQAALRSVLAQEGVSFEVVAVNDGSADEHAAAYAAVERDLGAGRPVTFLRLGQTAAGHGVSHATNAAARRARGRFLCFLDDDDTWTDAGHLARARDLVERVPGAELMLFDQEAVRGGETLKQPIWLEDLGARLRAGGTGAAGPAFDVTVEQLLTATGFSHLNTTIVAAGLFRRLGGFDETLPWEQDRDFFLRAIDAAGSILYCPVVVARHNVPETGRAANITTRVSALDKRLFQVALLSRAAGTARNPAIRRYGRQHRRFALQKAWAAAGTWRDRWRVGMAVLGVLTGTLPGRRAGRGGA